MNKPKVLFQTIEPEIYAELKPQTYETRYGFMIEILDLIRRFDVSWSGIKFRELSFVKELGERWVIIMYDDSNVIDIDSGVNWNVRQDSQFLC